MNIYEFKEYVKERKPLSSDEIHQSLHSYRSRLKSLRPSPCHQQER